MSEDGRNRERESGGGDDGGSFCCVGGDSGSVCGGGLYCTHTNPSGTIKRPNCSTSLEFLVCEAVNSHSDFLMSSTTVSGPADSHKSLPLLLQLA